MERALNEGDNEATISRSPHRYQEEHVLSLYLNAEARGEAEWVWTEEEGKKVKGAEESLETYKNAMEHNHTQL